MYSVVLFGLMPRRKLIYRPLSLLFHLRGGGTSETRQEAFSVVSFQSVIFGLKLSHFKSCRFFWFFAVCGFAVQFPSHFANWFMPQTHLACHLPSVVLVLSKHDVSSAITCFFVWFNSFQLPDIFKVIAWWLSPTDSSSEGHFLVCAYHI